MLWECVWGKKSKLCVEVEGNSVLLYKARQDLFMWVGVKYLRLSRPWNVKRLMMMSMCCLGIEWIVLNHHSNQLDGWSALIQQELWLWVGKRRRVAHIWRLFICRLWNRCQNQILSSCHRSSGLNHIILTHPHRWLYLRPCAQTEPEIFRQCFLSSKNCNPKCWFWTFHPTI